MVQHPSLVALRRRQRAGAINRRVGWVLLPVMVAATDVHYLPWAIGTSVLAAVLVVGVVAAEHHPPRAVGLRLRVRPAAADPEGLPHLLRLPLGVVIWASQTNLDNEPLHTYLTILMFAGIGVHLLLGVRYAARRRAA